MKVPEKAFGRWCSNGTLHYKIEGRKELKHITVSMV